METFQGLLMGFEIAFQPENLALVVLGVLIGTMVGLLPGLGPTASIAVLLPITYHMDAASAIIMLAGIYYGGMYGGRIPAILLNIPGDASSVITTLDGYPLSVQGRAGSALGITAVGSFIGGTFAIVGLTMFAPIVAQYATRIGPPEMFVLALMGILMVTFIGKGGSKLKAIIAAGLGLLAAGIGIDQMSGVARLTFGSIDLSSGLDIIPVAVGLFGLSEILYNLDRGLRAGLRTSEMGSPWPRWKDWVQTRTAIFRSSIIGFVIGIMPGGGGALSSIIAYGAQKRLSKDPKKFGKGAMDGLAATETADNASSNAAFIPMLTLGLPPNPVLAIILGALLLQNVTPGPNLINNNPDIFWGVIASMYIGNLVLLLLNVPLIGVFVQVLRIKGAVLYPIIVVIAFAGVYSANNNVFDVWVAVVFGVIGYLFKKFRFDPAPFILAFILGPIMETEFVRSMLMSGGQLSVFVSRPGSGMMLAVLAAILFTVGILSFRSRRSKRMEDEGPDLA